MSDDSSGEKTEKATGKRRDEARKKGQVAKSQEVNGAILLIVGMSLLILSSGHFFLAQKMRNFQEQISCL